MPGCPMPQVCAPIQEKAYVCEVKLMNGSALGKVCNKQPLGKFDWVYTFHLLRGIALLMGLTYLRASANLCQCQYKAPDNI